jgi:vitamin B12 transporter
VPPFRALARIAPPFALLLCGPARAQEANETIQVQGERPQEAPRAPAAPGSVIEPTKFAGELRSLPELLLNSPGVSVHSLGGPGQVATLSLRGASADESVVLLDGIPLQGPGGGAVDLSTIPATLLDRVRVTRGVLGAQFGAGALGGAVELIPQPPRASARAHAQAAAGSFGTYQLTGDVSGPLGSGGATLGLQGDRTSGDFDYARQLTPSIPGSPWYGYTRANADALRGSALARFAQPAGAGEFDGILQLSAGDRGLPGPANAVTARSRERDETGLAGVRLTGPVGDATWTLRGWGRLDRIVLSGVQPFGDCADGDPGCPRSDQRGSAARAEGELHLPIGSSQSVDLGVSGGEDRVHGGDAGAHARGAISLALRGELAPSAGLSLYPALRLDAVGRQTGVSPALAAAWAPRPDGPLTVRAGWGLSFRAPSFNELYLATGTIAPNPDLQPERAWSVDLGASLRAAGVSVSADLFWSSWRDLIVYELNPSANRVRPLNIGRAHIAGAELQAALPLGRGFSVELAYTWLQALNQRPGERQDAQLAYRTPHELRARLAHRSDRLEGYAEGSFTSATPRNDYGTATLPAQLVFNAGAGVRAAGPLWLDVEVKNVLDDQTLEDLFQYPLPGRSIAMIARVRL